MIQCQCINKILADKDASFLTLNNLTEDFFSDYQKEFRYIRDHIQQYGNVPDTESFLAEFPQFDILTVNESSRYLLDELYKDYNTRSLAKTFNKIRNLLVEGKVEEAVKIYMSASQDLSKVKRLDSIDILRDTSRYDDYVDHMTDYNKYYIKTGYKELDQILGGWERYEELATIVARPGVGKTWSLLKCALAAAEQGLTVGIYSGEMSERKVGYRIDTLASHISNYKMIHGNADIQNEYKRYIDSIADKIPGKIKVLTPAMIGGSAGVTALRGFIDKDKLDILFIDQHSLLEDDRGAKNPVEKASNISKDLKTLQVLTHIPIISVSQKNRGAKDDEISEEDKFDLSRIAASDRIGQDSTTVIYLEKKDNVLTLYLVKSRDSVNGAKLQYAVDIDKGIFTYLPTEKDGLNGQSCEEVKREFERETNPGEDVF